MSKFQKATKKKQKARVALVGVAGSGKTMTSLIMARGFVGPDGKIAVIDTERGTASKYSGDKFPKENIVHDFDVLELQSFEPENYIAAMRDAANEGYGVIIIDSLSHAWIGEGGLLDQKDNMGGSFQSWAKLTPKHRNLIDAILAYPGHVIATMRAKTEYVISTNDKGKPEPKRVGLAPQQRDNMEFEFDVYAIMDGDAVMTVEKSRCPALRGKTIREPTTALATQLLAWLDDGADAPSAPKSEPKPVNGDLEERASKARAAIDACKTIEELDAVGAALKKSPAEIQQAVTADYVAKLNAIKGQAA